ncbi:DUF4132 domain-containing protein [Streptomyces sp. NBC_00341]|uniref:WGR and DUF4132 domain-containing protein n=1 Tax=Streptomyces sp. NBC_00341 TaxID=2975717 RepID=UPI003090EF0B|nr:DUF4132 domain-containing protein [Streptomyces sp. NBC_00341]
MRRWEYVEGSASKFWETGADGAVVTVRHGRCGSDGRTQTKEYASARAADAQVAKSVAEKERKGYREVGAAAPSGDGPAAEASTSGAGVLTGQPRALPDEDTFVLPAGWQRLLHPRRGGVARTPARPQRKALDALSARTAEEMALTQEFLDSPRSDPALVDQVRHHLAGCPSPAGAAGLASIVRPASPTAATWVDSWVRDHGLPFAARATVELFMVRARWERGGQVRSGPWLEALPRPHYIYWANAQFPEADRVRALLAATDEETYRATVEGLTRCRTDAHRRIATAYLAPSETDWVAALCTDPEVIAGQDYGLLSLVYCTLNSAEQAAAFPPLPGLCQSLARIATMAEGIGTAVVPLLAEWLKNTYTDADGRRQIANALVEVPTDEAFLLLLDRAYTKQVNAALAQAMLRYPVRALRLLTAHVRDRPDRTYSTAQLLLPRHIAAHRSLVEAVLPTLDSDLVKIVEPLLNPVNRVADASDADTLPSVLTAPPWTRPLSKAKRSAVTGLTAASEPAVVWLPGEREQWAAATTWYNRRQLDGDDDWEETIATLQHGLNASSLQPAWVYAHGPEELVAPALAVWDPTDLWNGSDTLKPIAARFGLDALPLLLRTVPRQPSSLAPLLLPFIDVTVARHMAAWAARLKSTGALTRSWFERHGVAAAPLLVPDAVGKAGPARRAAERALFRIAAVHGDAVVHGAAERHGDLAVEAVAELLAADPLERALPVAVPALPGWADPARLPPIAVRSGGALPQESVCHVLTMLAMSRPGEVYPGLDDVVRTADPASLTEFAWKLFEQWQFASCPAEGSWALSALGLLGDAGTVRRLTPVICYWPVQGDHHRAVEGLDVLAAIGGDAALRHLHDISQRVKSKALKIRATEKIAEVASDLGLTGEQLSDRLVPDLGLDAEGSTVLDYGTRTFTVGFDEQLRPYVVDGVGKLLKGLPTPGSGDDMKSAQATRKRFTALKRDVRTIASDQVCRLETAMVTGRSWSAQEFHDLFVAHPLVWHLVRRLVWLSGTDEGHTAFRVAEDRTFTDAGSGAFTLPEDATVRPAHPLHLGEELTAWSEVFADHGIQQPFAQLGRGVFTLSEAEAGSDRLKRFEGLQVPAGRVLGLLRHGWERGVPQDAGVERWISKRLGDDCCLVIALREVIAAGTVGMDPGQTLETVWLDTRPDDYRESRDHTLRFSGLDAVTVSELLADLTELTEGVAA